MYHYYINSSMYAQMFVVCARETWGGGGNLSESFVSIWRVLLHCMLLIFVQSYYPIHNFQHSYSILSIHSVTLNVYTRSLKMNAF